MNVTTFRVEFDTTYEATQKESPERLPEKVVANFTQYIPHYPCGKRQKFTSKVA